MRRGVVPVLALAAVAVGACSRPAGSSIRVASALRPEAVSEIVVARPAPPVDASTGSQAATASSAEPVVKSELPPGCEVFETNDVCKTLQALVDARTRLINRPCAGRFHRLLPDYRIGCEWQRFVRKPVVGVDSKDCYKARYDGEGIVCWLDDPKHGGEYDASFPYEAVQKALAGCLPGWKYEETSKAKVHSDRAFSLSKVSEDGAGKSMIRVQACLFTQAPRGIDEHPMKVVRIEAFAEPQIGTADGGTR
jgi:hypothetical protein